MRIDQVQESKMLLDALKEAQSRLVPYIVTQSIEKLMRTSKPPEN
jgi:hypothetical protein